MNYKEVFKLGKDIKGSYVELGFGSGVTARQLISLITGKQILNRPIWIFDSFKGIPTPTAKDLSFDNTLTKGKFSKPVQPALDLRFEVPSTPYNVVRGYIENTLDQFTDNHISILNLDLSSYSSTLTALKTLHRFVPRNGVLVVPGYSSNEGVRTAVDDFFSANNLSHQNKGADFFINTLAKQFIPSTTKKDTTFKEQRLPVKDEQEPTPYRDRYTKNTPKSLNYRKQIREGATVINKKVTR